MPDVELGTHARRERGGAVDDDREPLGHQTGRTSPVTMRSRPAGPCTISAPSASTSTAVPTSGGRPPPAASTGRPGDGARAAPPPTRAGPGPPGGGRRGPEDPGGQKAHATRRVPGAALRPAPRGLLVGDDDARDRSRVHERARAVLRRSE